MEQGYAVAVAQARAGDPIAFRHLVERHSRGVFRLAFRMTGNEQDSEDQLHVQNQRHINLRAHSQAKNVFF